jgi:hypothetical protein
MGATREEAERRLASLRSQVKQVQA